MNPTQAMTEVILNMDTKGQELLIKWIMENSWEDVLAQREWDSLSKEHLKRISKNEG